VGFLRLLPTPPIAADPSVPVRRWLRTAGADLQGIARRHLGNTLPVDDLLVQRRDHHGAESVAQHRIGT
jgi:hypothetical protein